jgi:type II secretory pathway pseudopilin PulG
MTLLELLIVVAIIGTLVAMSALVLPSALASARADAGASQALAVLRTCREQAVTDRRLVTVAFEDANRIACRRREITAAGLPSGVLTLVGEALLAERMEFLRIPGLPDTPDAFAAGVVPVDFTGPAPWSFTSEGTLVDANGDVVNGTVFLGREGEPLTTRAVTLFGATALLREWQWNGTAWAE